MEDDGMTERERYQIEQIRQLDSEELQVEEVDGESADEDEINDRSYGGASVSGEFTFNTCLASLHTYLGEVEDTHHRLAFLDGGAILNLPLFYLEGVVLFPEAILPLRVIQPNFVAAVETALRQVVAPFTIGVVHVYEDPETGRMRFAKTGTTAEIRQYRRLEDGSVNVVTRGQQRFCLKRRWIDAQGAPCGEIQIIQEDMPLRTPRDVVGRMAPLRNLPNVNHLQGPPFITSQGGHHAYRGEDPDSDAISEESFESELSTSERRLHHTALASHYDCHDMTSVSTKSDDERFIHKSDFQFERSYLNDTIESFYPNDFRNENTGLQVRKKIFSDGQSHKGRGMKKYLIDGLRDVPGTFWPSWVYGMYDSYRLAQRAAVRWKQIVGVPSMDGLVTKPDILSFHIASKIPVSESTRQELLDIDGVSYRLRREIELLDNFDRIQCRNCKTLIARRSDMLVMSSEGPLSAYVNPHGFVHEIMTFYKVNSLALIGHPVKEYSWFPGYAWAIAKCTGCESQMGWRFTATKKKLKPRLFWAIRSSQVADEMR